MHSHQALFMKVEQLIFVEALYQEEAIPLSSVRGAMHASFGLNARGCEI